MSARAPDPRRTWLLVVGGWGGMAAAFIMADYGRQLVAGQTPAWGLTALMTVLAFTIWAVATPAIVAWSRRFPIEGPRRTLALLAHLPAALVVASLHPVLHVFLATRIRPLAPGVALEDVMVREVLGLGPVGLVIYTALVAADHSLRWRQAFREKELAAARIAENLTRVRLNALRDRLHPHFLFNTLHAISALMGTDVGAARRTMAELSDLLRKVLDEEDDDPETTLGREVELTGHYLAIMQTRFPDRLRVEVDVPPELADARVPRLLLQPLVENAVRHGVGPGPAGGTVRVAAAADGGRLLLRVEDDGVGGAVAGVEGEGLRNTRARLGWLYGEAQSLVLRDAPGGGSIAAVSLPLRTGREARP